MSAHNVNAVKSALSDKMRTELERAKKDGRVGLVMQDGSFKPLNATGCAKGYSHRADDVVCRDDFSPRDPDAIPPRSPRCAAHCKHWTLRPPIAKMLRKKAEYEQLLEMARDLDSEVNATKRAGLKLPPDDLVTKAKDVNDSMVRSHLGLPHEELPSDKAARESLLDQVLNDRDIELTDEFTETPVGRFVARAVRSPGVVCDSMLRAIIALALTKEDRHE